MGGRVELIGTKGDFESKVKQSQGVVIVDAYADWCGPCKAIAPKVDSLSEQYPDAKFYKIDVDELTDVAAELGIRAMPTFLIFKDGNQVGEVVGANPPALEAGIKQHL
ncbi:thioredoxin TrxA [Aspergillus campestris IBT 28561]|uniref:Thioredoxin n=1 Tax=Aspergillus campestris (strain IBT 28561) TaxID=1392248 RepID=A0A2I1D1C0_ASPC2|nr:thioredoxin TrxA [Aspergillus campestris IBT 28561]PKY03673.1 thioredoxin TrxA [Aspergillus campestris IBT 28561]